MVFSSLPAYLDPSNWQQQPSPQLGTSSGNPNQFPPPTQPPPPPPLPQSHVGGGAGSVRPGSMADRARMANIPLPETALKCPRCDSSNTKFCYFNNYSLSQPRHFCKTCRRYWTRGGALRNVPVGGGCRRNKRSSKGSSSKSPVSGDRQSSGGGGGSTSAVSSSTTSSTGTASLLGLTPQIPPLRFMAPLSQLTEFGSAELGLNYPAALVGSSDMNFQLGSFSLGGGGVGSYISGGGGVGGGDWRFQPPQISSLAGLDLASGLYPFQGGLESSGYGGEGSHVRPKLSASGLSQMASVKMEDSNNQELNLSRQFLGIQGNDQYWVGNAWTDLSGFSSSSTTNHL